MARQRQSVSQKLGQKARALRIQAGLTQAQVAERAELATESISRLETGRLSNLSIDATARLAAALGVEISALFEGISTKVASGPRAIEKRLLALLEPLSDEDLADVYQGMRRLLGVRARTKRK
jgi:transcriptional regulator with XRE-family HTH domain